MSRQWVMVLSVLLLVVGGGALLIFKQQQDEKPAVSAQLGQPLLKGLKASEITRIEIRESKETLTLERKDERWVLVERGGFAADLEKVSDLVIKAIELKVGQAEPLGEKDRERLSLNEPGKDNAATSLVFKGADGKVLAELWLGKKYFKNTADSENPRAPGDGRFVMLPSDTRQVFLISDPLRQASAASSGWIARDGLSIERVKVLEVKSNVPADSYRIERLTDGIDWKLSGPAAKLDISRANAASYSLNKLEIDDLAPADQVLTQPTVLTANTFDGLTYVLEIGALEGERYPVRVKLSGTPNRTAPPARAEAKAEENEKRAQAFADEVKKLEARVAREQALSSFVLMINKAKLVDTLKKRAELLEVPKPAAKK